MKKRLELGKLFASIGLGVRDAYKVSKGKYSPLSNDNIFPFEKKSSLFEYRIELGRILDEEWLKEMHSIENPTIEEYKKVYGNKWIDDFIQDKERLGEIDGIDESLSFSVFLPEIKNLKNPLFIDKVWDCASNYLHFISKTYIDVIVNYKNNDLHKINGNDAIFYNTKLFSKLLNEIGVKITNDNLSPIEGINYRLYKDNKFFHELSYYCSSRDYDYISFVKEAINASN